jgi:hypothetical protein
MKRRWLLIATAITMMLSVWLIAQQSGRESQPVTVTIVAPDPVITLHSPTTVTAGGPEFTLLVNGTGFLTNSTIRWNGQDRPTTYVSATELQAQIPATDIGVAGTAQVTVFTPEPQPSAYLEWDTSPTPTVVGYNLYRSQQDGGPYALLNPTLIPTLTYVDGTIQQGNTYFYVARARSSNGEESVNSNQAVATVP